MIINKEQLRILYQIIKMHKLEKQEQLRIHCLNQFRRKHLE